MLDLIVKERDSLAVVGCASYAFPIRSQAHFTAFAPGRFGPAGTAAALSHRSACFAVSARRHYRDVGFVGKRIFLK